MAIRRWHKPSGNPSIFITLHEQRVSLYAPGQMQWLFSPEASLWSLLLATFLAATLIPLSSEVALFAVLKLHRDLLWPAIGIATLGNTLGGLTSYLIGRYLGRKKPLSHVEKV